MAMGILIHRKLLTKGVKIIETNIGNISNLTKWAYQGGSVTYKSDKAEARTNGTARNIVSTKLINLSSYNAIRIYGNLTSEYSNASLAVWFGVLKQEVLPNPPAYMPNNSFLASKRISSLRVGNYIEVDVSKVKGSYNIGAYGIGNYDVYKFELIS